MKYQLYDHSTNLCMLFKLLVDSSFGQSIARLVSWSVGQSVQSVRFIGSSVGRLVSSLVGLSVG